MGKLAAVLDRNGHHPRLLRYVLVAFGLLLLVGLLAGVKAAQISTLMRMGKQMEQAGPPPEAVGSTKARTEAWETTVSAVGTIASLRSVAVSNELPGTVTRIRFQSGSLAKKGDVLVELDTSVESAQVATAEARRKLAEHNVRRSRILAKSDALPRQQLDEAEAARATATADLAALKAQLERKQVRAPFDGRLGIRAVNVGQFLPPGTTVTTVDAVGATLVDFSLPQEQLPLVSVGQPVRVTIEGSKAPPLAGTISAIESAIDPATRNIKLRATLTQGEPPPGMFVNVEVVRPKQETLVVVPVTAIIHAPFGDSVFVIEPKTPGSPGMSKTPDGKPVSVARQQFVRLGPQHGDFVAITKGVRAGQTLVTAGGFKLRNNSPVVVDNRVAAKPQEDPKPENR